MRFACEETRQSPDALARALGFRFVQLTIDMGFEMVGSAVARDFAGMLVNANDYMMHTMHAMGRGRGGYTVPEFRAENVSSHRL